MKYLRNQKGMSMIGVLIAASIGLVIVIGISKTLMKFSEQTTKSNRKQIVTQVHGNLNNLLRARRKMWDPSKAKAAGCNYPGQKGSCPLKLFRDADPGGPSSNVRQFTCPGKTFKDGIGFFATSGTLTTVNNAICAKCKSDSNCGLDPKKYIRFNVSYNIPPTATNSFQIPDFLGTIEDRGGAKHVQKFDSLNDSEGILIYQDTFRCTNPGEFIQGVNPDGTPVCVTFSSLGRCSNGSFMVGYLSSGAPDCRTLNLPSPVVNIAACRSGQLMAGISNNRATCRTDKVGTTTIVNTGGGGGGGGGSSSSKKWRLDRDCVSSHPDCSNCREMTSTTCPANPGGLSCSSGGTRCVTPGGCRRYVCN